MAAAASYLTPHVLFTRAMNHRFAWLLTAVALSFSLQAVIAFRSPIIAVDGTRFVEMARALDESPRQAMVAFNQHPGYPAMLLVAAKALGSASGRTDSATFVLAGQIISALFGPLSVVMVWLLARRLLGDQIANIAAVMFACIPLVRQNAADLLSDTPHLTCYLLAAWCVASGFRSARAGWFLAGGAAGGLAFWIRPEGLSVVLVAGALATIWVAGRSEFGRIRQIGCLASLLAAAAIVVAPYTVLADKITSKKGPLAGPQSPAFRQMPFVNDAQSPAPLAATNATSAGMDPAPAVGANGRPVEAIAEEPSGRAWSARIAAAIAKFLSEVAYGFRYLLLVPLVCGCIVARRRMPDKRSLTVVVFLAAFHSLLLLWLHHTAGYIGHRHVIPLVALGMPFVALGTLFIAEASFRHFGRRRWYSAARIGMIATVAVVLVPRCVRPLNYAHRPVIEVAAWIKEHGNATGAVLTNSLLIPFYADAPADVLGVGITDMETALSSSRGMPDYELVVLEIDARRFQPPHARLQEKGYLQVYHRDGGARRPWKQFHVYRQTPDVVEASKPTESTAGNPRDQRR